MDAEQPLVEKNRIWLDEYPPGVPADIDLTGYTSLADLLQQACARYGARTAYHSLGASLSYAEVDRYSLQFASYLQGCGLQRGDRVALMMPNLLAYPVALFGVLRAGLTAVNVNPLYTPREVEHQLSDSGTRAVVVVENFCATLQQALPKTPVERVIVARMADLLPFPRRAAVHFVVKRVRKLVRPWRIEGHELFVRALKSGAKRSYRKPALTLDDRAFLQYTGGTTGLAKGAELTHGNVLANVLQIRHWIAPVLGESQGRVEVIVTALPLYHIFALTVNCLTFFTLGGENLLIADPRDLKGFVKALAQHRFSVITGVNTLFNGLLHQPGFARLDFSSLRLTVGGGAAVHESTARRWHEVTGCALAEGYGLTETSPVVCFTPVDKLGWNGSIGVPLPSTWVALRDDDNRDAAPGPGELCVKGPQVMRGYWNRPQDTAEVFTPDGYLRTGDIATVDERGYFRIVDRKKDMILVSGFNVYPNEIEAVVTQHPGVLEAACVGMPDARTGEAVRLFVVKKDPSLTAETLRAYCKKHLTGYKVPQSIEFRDQLPKSPIGKILRKQLKPGA